MTINYHVIIVAYLPVAILYLMFFLKDRYEPSTKALKLCTWTLLPGILLTFYFSNLEVFRSLWFYKQLPILKNIPFNYSNWEVFYMFYSALGLVFTYVLFRYFYKIDIKEVFNIKSHHLSFIVKVCGVLAVINLLGLIFLDFDLFFNPRSLAETISSMDLKYRAVFFINALVLGPVVEETIFRGLIYAPLYRKLGRRMAMIVTSLTWACMHFEALFPSIQLFIIGLFIHGLVFTWLYDRRGSLIHPIVFHIFVNSWIIYYVIVS